MTIPGLITAPTPQPQAGADVAYTPDAVVAALLAPEISPALPEPGYRIWEPCAGAGAFVRGLRALERLDETWIEATEIDPVAAALSGATVADAATHIPFQGRAVTCEIWTNPPFSLADDLLRAWLALPVPPHRVVLLMRQGWINAEKRRWVLPHLSAEIVLVPRISFGGPGSGRTATQTDTHNHVVLDIRPPRRGVTCRSPGMPVRSYMYDWKNRQIL